VALTPCPVSYGQLVSQGFDSVQEALNLQPSPAFTERLDVAQRRARDLSVDLDATVDLPIGPEIFKAHATGARGGFKWRLENDDMLILIGSPRRDWTISIRYSSAGLWEHGLEALRNRAFEALRGYTTQRDNDVIRVSRIDYCFDFHSEAFTREFTPAAAEHVVCHSSSKVHMAGQFNLWARGGRGETITIGSKAGLQVSIYDKCLEITEASGKTWLYDVWKRDAGEWLWGDAENPQDMWRLECRFNGEYLKDRNVRRPHEVKASLSELVGEALYTRRLAVPTEDSNRSRWPMSPLWSEAVRAFNPEAMLPMGRLVTGRRGALVDRGLSALAGNLISLGVLKNGAYDPDKIWPMLHEAQHRARSDDDLSKKVDAARSRYRDVEEAR